MREIKFRAWDGMIMRYDVTGFEHGFENEMAGVFLDGDYYRIDENTPVMQYTGLKDKNCVEIYEGDLVRTIEDFGTDQYSDTRNVDREVAFQGGAFYPVCMYPPNSEDCEIIGNIYENPELVEK